jgi:hypothetical protein
MSSILLAAALGVGLSFFAFIMCVLRYQRQRRRNPSLRLLGNVSKQWLIGHRAEQ